MPIIKSAANPNTYNDFKAMRASELKEAYNRLNGVRVWHSEDTLQIGQEVGGYFTEANFKGIAENYLNGEQKAKESIGYCILNG